MLTDAIFTESVAGRVIERALARGRLAHALLLHGGDVESLTLFARHLAARLLQLPPGWAASGTSHPDFNTLRPSGKARQIRIGDDNTEANTMRHFIRQLAQSPLAGPRKIGAVIEADRMNPNAANAFLKTLEEPPPSTTILLLTTRPYSLLTTIRSRCLNFRLPAAPEATDDAVLRGWLEDFQAWLRSLETAGADRAAAGRQVMAVYGFVARYSKWIEDAGARALDQLRATGALEQLDDDETEALKVSTTVGVRQRFLAAVERTTCAVARESTTGTAAAPAAVRELERAAGLLRVNFNEGAALELYLLATLRAWSRRDG
jgi:DNA polymerase III subunit delta'